MRRRRPTFEAKFAQFGMFDLWDIPHGFLVRFPDGSRYFLRSTGWKR